MPTVDRKHRSPLLDGAAKPRLRGVLHTYGAIAGAIAGAALIALAPGATARIAATIFALASTGMLTVSALLHRRDWTLGQTIRLLQLDHTMIFLTIAGTYTAIALLGMSSGWAILVLVAVWVGALGGIVFEWLPIDAPRGYVTTVYVTLGWVAVLAFGDLWIHAGVLAFALIAAGGLLYTGGAIVHAARRPDPVPHLFGYHEIFHACVLGALACHYAAIVVLFRA
ncbi:MAG TPA: hemolysin III family protein [Acidimicrobiia bacterium]|nr:hemolysin III family protein [Acidimicrobiia bacterium]